MMAGGLGDAIPADDDIKLLIESGIIKSAAEEKYGKPFAEYTAVSYKSQVVAGTNFFVKVNVGGDECVHLKIFRPLPNDNAMTSLTDLQAGKKESDPIEFF